MSDLINIGTGFGGVTIGFGSSCSGMYTPKNMRDFKKQTAEIQNIVTQNVYMRRLYKMAVSRIEFLGIEDKSINKRFMVKCLIERGSICVFRDEVLGLIALPFTMNGPLDAYGDGVKRTAIGYGYSNSDLNRDNSVIGWTSYDRSNTTIHDLAYFANQITECVRQYDVNTSLLNQSPILNCTYDELNSAQAVYTKMQNHEPIIFGRKDDITNTKNFDSTLDIKTYPDRTSVILDNRDRWWREALDYLGIENVSVNKKERLVSGEVDSNLGDTVASRFDILAPLQDFCDEVNDMFGTNWSVQFRGNETANYSSDVEKTAESESEVDDNE